MSSGTLNLRHDVGGDLTELTGDVGGAKRLVEEVDEIFVEHGAPRELRGVDHKAVDALVKRASAAGIEFIPIPQRHIGSEHLPRVVNSIKRELEEKGVRFVLNTSVKAVKKKGALVRNRWVRTKYVLAAPGRVGAGWLAEQARALGIKFTHGPIDIGARVEIPTEIMATVAEVSHDPKFHIRTKTYRDFVRTFCANFQGFVMEERYDGFAGVNGQSLRAKKSPNANFAMLVRIELTQPVTDTLAYGRSIASLATTIGGGFPLLQRLEDLRAGRRSTWGRIKRGKVKPTLWSVTPGDISMALPGRIVTDLVEGLERLDRVIPGVASDESLLYAPEAKFYAMRVIVDKRMQTSVPGLFVAGDGAGLSRGIVTAAATGLLAARGIQEKEG